MANGESQPPGADETGDLYTPFSEPVFAALRQRTDIFEDLIGYVPLSFDRSVAVRHGELPESAAGDEVSGNFFSGLSVRMERGRGFTFEDEKNHAAIVVLSYNYWTRSFARDPKVVGQTIYIKGVPVTVVGITAYGFKGVEPATATDFVEGMVTILSAVVSIFVFRFRSRAALELKLVALEHQLAVLRRRRPGRPQLSSLDRLL